MLLNGVLEQLENAETEECYWELKKFMVLVLKANPNILEYVYTPLVETRTLDSSRIGVRPPGAWGRRPPEKPANENAVTTGFGVELIDSEDDPQPGPPVPSLHQSVRTVSRGDRAGSEPESQCRRDLAGLSRENTRIWLTTVKEKHDRKSTS
jgi:hypothetical protein